MLICAYAITHVLYVYTHVNASSKTIWYLRLLEILSSNRNKLQEWAKDKLMP